MSDRERAARNKRKQEARVMAKLGKEAGQKFVKRCDLETIDKMSRDQFQRMLNLTSTDDLPHALAEYLTGQPNFAKLLTKSVRRELTEKNRSWISEVFVLAFVDGMLNQWTIERRCVAGDLSENARRELVNLNKPKPADPPVVPRREVSGQVFVEGTSRFVTPAPSMNPQFVTTQGNSFLAARLHSLPNQRRSS